MHKDCPKKSVLAALCVTPDVSGIRELPALDSKKGHVLMRWIDRSGLALRLWRQLQEYRVTDELSPAWRSALTQRLADNAARTNDMMAEFQRVNEAFQRLGVKAVALKGFTLMPDFCDDATLRHQTDFDFLAAPEDVEAAAEALQVCGYRTARLSNAEETCFTTPTQYVPSTDDYLYSRQHQRQVDLHVSLWERSPWLKVETPTDSMGCAVRQILAGREFWSLSIEDKFLLQVLHIFRHSIKSWIRLSWLLEVGQCMELHREDGEFWRRVSERAGESELMKKVFAFVLGLVHRLFEVRAPLNIERWMAGTDVARLETWIEQFGLEWAATDWPGGLKNLFVAGEFIPDPTLRAQYWRSRLLPKKANGSIGTIETRDTKNLARLRWTRARYVVQRATAHIKEICELPAQSWRWRNAIESTRGTAVETKS